MDGAAFEPLDGDADFLEAVFFDAELRVVEEDPLEDEDLAEADFLLPAELELARAPDDLLPEEERPDEARPEDWLRDFFIDYWFYDDD